MPVPEPEKDDDSDAPEPSPRPSFIGAFLKAVVFWTVIVFGAMFLISLVIELIG